MNQALCQGYKNKKDLFFSLEELMFFHSRVIIPLDFELLMGKNSIINLIPLLPTTGPRTH